MKNDIIQERKSYRIGDKKLSEDPIRDIDNIKEQLQKYSEFFDERTGTHYPKNWRTILKNGKTS